MNTIIEIDKAGRIVVPKRLRDALHLTPGARLRIEQEGGWLILRPASGEAQLVVEDGAPLIFPADRLFAPVLTSEMVNDIAAQGRREREQRFVAPNVDRNEGTA